MSDFKVEGCLELQVGKALNDWEMEVVQNFLSTMDSRSYSPQFKDKLWWKETKSGCYSIKSCFDLLEGGRQHQLPIKMLWNPIVPTKVGFCAWEVWWGKILTLNQLQKRGFSLGSRCSLCKEAKEAMEHLLIHCPKIWCMRTNPLQLDRRGLGLSLIG